VSNANSCFALMCCQCLMYCNLLILSIELLLQNIILTIRLAHQKPAPQIWWEAMAQIHCGTIILMPISQSA
jgi:hypothetical protein